MGSVNKCINYIIGKIANIKFSLYSKIILGYFLIIAIPNVISFTVYYRQFSEMLTWEYIGNRHQYIVKLSVSLQNDMKSAEHLCELYQSNVGLCDYLNGLPPSEGEYVYKYLRDIAPLEKYINSTINTVNGSVIYKLNDRTLRIQNSIEYISLIDEYFESEIDLLKGIWKLHEYDDHISMCFYKYIYNNDFSKPVGIIKVELDDDLLTKLIENLKDDNNASSTVILQIIAGNSLVLRDGDYYTQNANLYEIDNNDTGYKLSGDVKKIATYSAKMLDVGMEMFVIDEIDEHNILLTGEQVNLLIAFFTFTMIMMSFFYLFILHNITGRLIRFANHIKKAGTGELKEFKGNIGEDEIGKLVQSYNNLINKINEMIVQVREADTLRKEAAYMAMQAQIKPHFLYGTIETIRLIANMEGNSRIEKIAFSFGKMMRYTLTVNNDNVTLGDELENISNFLEIYSYRYEDRLSYNIDCRIDAKNFICPQYILQPLVENALYHGFRRDSQALHINILVYETTEKTEIVIKDNGIGIQPERLNEIHKLLNGSITIDDFSTSKSGFAIFNIHQRIKYFYGENSYLSLKSLYGIGTVSSLTMAKKSVGRHSV